MLPTNVADSCLFLYQKVGKEPECLAFSTKYKVEFQNVGDALLVSSHDLGFTLCSSFVIARIWQLYALKLKVTHQLDNHLKKSNARNHKFYYIGFTKWYVNF